jgi:hypothetical protein
MGVERVNRWLRVCVFLVGLGCGSAALAASMTDFSETEDDIFWMFGYCLVSGTLGYGLGVKLRITRDIVNAT